TKYLKKIGLKLFKILKDMLMNLIERINWDKDVYKNIQTIRIIYQGLMMLLVYTDNLKEYICKFHHSNLMEVPDM
ncbi:29345_t:CDS:2, partial [Gigaspora margarita]